MEIPSFSDQRYMVFSGTSVNNKYSPPGTHAGPSAHVKPSASFSIRALLAMISSSAASQRSMRPTVGYFDSPCCAGAHAEASSAHAINTCRRMNPPERAPELVSMLDHPSRPAAHSWSAMRSTITFVAIAAAGTPLTRPLVISNAPVARISADDRSEEHTSELQSRENLVCRLLLEKK